ncbi:hypothetical protein [Caenimonas soli]|uniref:hypothetical protein n=1 Tax=Caenimonas soli TaxID=2735555 RepID=UPI001555F998|nr:hypothetical protein [Caenimonas soli]NPC56663.1 hypothetical protein [Caenimonas soli]
MLYKIRLGPDLTFSIATEGTRIIALGFSSVINELRMYERFARPAAGRDSLIVTRAPSASHNAIATFLVNTTTQAGVSLTRHAMDTALLSVADTRGCQMAASWKIPNR